MDNKKNVYILGAGVSESAGAPLISERVSITYQ